MRIGKTKRKGFRYTGSHYGHGMYGGWYDPKDTTIVAPQPDTWDVYDLRSETTKLLIGGSSYYYKREDLLFFYRLIISLSRAFSGGVVDEEYYYELMEAFFKEGQRVYSEISSDYMRDFINGYDYFYNSNPLYMNKITARLWLSYVKFLTLYFGGPPHEGIQDLLENGIIRYPISFFSLPDKSPLVSFLQILINIIGTLNDKGVVANLCSLFKTPIEEITIKTTPPKGLSEDEFSDILRIIKLYDNYLIKGITNNSKLYTSLLVKLILLSIVADTLDFTVDETNKKDGKNDMQNIGEDGDGDGEKGGYSKINPRDILKAAGYKSKPEDVHKLVDETKRVNDKGLRMLGINPGTMDSVDPQTIEALRGVNFNHREFMALIHMVAGKTRQLTQDILKKEQIAFPEMPEEILDTPELLHPKIRPFVVDDMEVEDRVFKKRVRLYVDTSGSTHSSIGDGKTRRVDVMMAAAVRLINQGLVEEVILYEARIIYRKKFAGKASAAVIGELMRASEGGGTRTEKVVEEIIESNSPAVIFTDGDDYISKYTNHAVFINFTDSYLRMPPKIRKQYYEKGQYIRFKDGNFEIVKS